MVNEAFCQNFSLSTNSEIGRSVKLSHGMWRENSKNTTAAIQYPSDRPYIHENGQKKKGNVASRVPASLSYVSAHQPSYVE